TFPQALAQAPAHGQARAIEELGLEDALSVAVHRADAIEADDRAPVDANECVRREASLEMAQGDPHQDLRPSGMDGGVIVGGLDPIDFVDLDEGQGSTRPRDQALEEWVPVPPRPSLRGLREPSLLDLSLRAPQGALEAFVTERLEQVVDGAGFEGLDR